MLPASHETVDAHEHFVYQEGRAVYKHAVTDMLTSSLSVMERNGLSVEDVDWLVPHQANLRIIEAVSRAFRNKSRESVGKHRALW